MAPRADPGVNASDPPGSPVFILAQVLLILRMRTVSPDPNNADGEPMHPMFHIRGHAHLVSMATTYPGQQLWFNRRVGVHLSPGMITCHYCLRGERRPRGGTKDNSTTG